MNEITDVIGKSRAINIKKVILRRLLILVILLSGWSVVVHMTLGAFKKIELAEKKEEVVSTVNIISDYFNNEYFAHVVNISKMSKIRDYFTGKIEEKDIYQILEVAKTIDSAVFAALIGVDGKIATLSSYKKRDKVLGLDISDRMYVIKGLRGEASIYLNFGRVSGMRTAQFAAPVFAENSREVLGIVMLNIKMQILDNYLSFIPEPSYLISPDNTVFSSNRKECIDKNLSAYSELIQDNQTGVDNFFCRNFYDSGSHYIEERIERFPGWVVLTIPELDFPYIGVTVATLVYLAVVLFAWAILMLRKRSLEALKASIAVDEAYRREREILEREAAAKVLVEKLEKSEARLRMTQESAGVGIWTYELDTEKLEWSGFISSVFDLSEDDLRDTLNSYLKSVYVDENEGVQQKIVSIIQNGESEEHECKIYSQDKSCKRWVSFKAKCLYSNDNKPLRIIGTILSIDERKEAEFVRIEMEEKIRHSQRLDAIGQLAGGIAHDFNNMLCGIIGSADILKQKLIGDKKGAELNSMIIATAERAADLTNQLLAFSRKQDVSLAITDMHEVIGATVKLLHRTIDLRIEIVQNLDARLSRITGDAAQLQNVIMNLGINAAHAMADSGVLEISTRNIELNEAYCDSCSFSLTPGKFLEIEVSDDGCGIEPEIVKKIFEPFFTTKEAGKGTGLGLSAVYGIVQQHHGAVNVYSEVGRGSCFHILLPLELEKKVTKKTDSDRLYMGKGRILVIDDEEVMRKNAKYVLSDLGYDVVTACNGTEGVELFVNDANGFDLVIVDMVMPVMNGRECFFELKKINSKIKVILASGFSRDKDVEEMKNAGLCEFIHKPYRSALLSHVVHDVLTKN